MATPTQGIASYYANLLILQYLQKVKAYATIQVIVAPALLPDSNVQFLSFDKTSASGHFQLSYDGVSTANIQWNDTAGTVQTLLTAILPSPITVVVTGSISAGLYFTFSNNVSAVSILTVSVNTLLTVDSLSILAAISSVGDQLPLTVQNAFNLIGSSIAVGAQLDILGKYAGVSRSGFGLNGPITLNDADFLLLIQMAIIQNNSGSSLADIQNLLNRFFAGQIYVFDYANMNMSYLINTSMVPSDLLQLFITEKLLPKPMAVGLSIIAVPIVDMFFAFGTYESGPSALGTPFNDYTSYNTSWLWLDYADGLFV